MIQAKKSGKTGTDLTVQGDTEQLLSELLSVCVFLIITGKITKGELIKCVIDAYEIADAEQFSISEGTEDTDE